jgi:hypothetical protein
MEPSVQVRRFLDGEGRIRLLPSKRTVRYAVLAYLAGKFEPGSIYTERQVNDVCEQWHTFHDFFILRRELVDSGLLGRERDGSRYWRIAEPTGGI